MHIIFIRYCHFQLQSAIFKNVAVNYLPFPDLKTKCTEFVEGLCAAVSKQTVIFVIRRNKNLRLSLDLKLSSFYKFIYLFMVYLMTLSMIG
jgi:hypothetical protein